jgi:hypothetical protein
MQEVMDKFFGPLDASYCSYFYFLSMIAFFSFVATSLGCLFGLLNKKKSDMKLCAALAVQSLFGYFMNRLLYSMCIGSLN